MRLRLKSPASRLFTQPLIQAAIKENIKAVRQWPLCGEFTGTGEFPAQMASNAEMFPFDDAIMHSLILMPVELIFVNERGPTLQDLF